MLEIFVLSPFTHFVSLLHPNMLNKFGSDFSLSCGDVVLPAELVDEISRWITCSQTAWRFARVCRATWGAFVSTSLAKNIFNLSPEERMKHIWFEMDPVGCRDARIFSALQRSSSLEEGGPLNVSVWFTQRYQLSFAWNEPKEALSRRIFSTGSDRVKNVLYKIDFLLGEGFPPFWKSPPFEPRLTFQERQDGRHVAEVNMFCSDEDERVSVVLTSTIRVTIAQPMQLGHVYSLEFCPNRNTLLLKIAL